MRITFLSLLFIFFLPLNVFAQGAAPSDLVRVRLIPEMQTVRGGDEIWIAIEQTIKPHWHTYWENPGDSGSKPNVMWDTPAGFTFGDIHWATPKKLPYQGLLNYGYEGQTVMLQKLRVPQDIPAGAITLTADLDILVCKEECIPVALTETLTLNAPNAIGADNAAFIAAAKDALPKTVTHDASYTVQGDDFTLIFTADGVSIDDIVPQSAEFFPADWGVIDNAAMPRVRINNGALTLTQARGDRPLTMLKTVNGVLKFNINNTTHAVNITAEQKALPAAAVDNVAPVNAADIPNQDGATTPHNLTAVTAVLFAFLGGLILNLMPCVFPVLSIKALSLVKLQDKPRAVVRRGGLAYMGGIVLTFLAIAGALLALKGFGAQIGWGFQLQNPVIVAALAYILFLVGLNFIGAFDFSFGQIGGGKFSQKLTSGNGIGASFFTGVLATIVAAPCVAPFMASAIGYALTRSAAETLLVFAALGVGLAAPYVALCYVPRLQNLMPKPGAWMNTFKQFLAFPMFASAAWLVWVLAKQVGAAAVMGALFGMVALGFSIWLLRLCPAKGVKYRKRLTLLALISFLIALGFLPVGHTPLQKADPATAAQISPKLAALEKEFGRPFSPETLATALTTNDPVFVEMTADWCITCKVNHKTSLNIKAIRQLFADKNVQYLIGDWTNQDPNITQFLTKYGRSGVPIYVFYAAPDDAGNRPAPKVLPQILTPRIVANVVNG